MEYFDTYGKLLEQDDIDGNWIYYAYVDETADPSTALVDKILDSWRQTITFQNDVGTRLSVTAPHCGVTTIVFGSQGVNSIQDAMKYTTSYITSSNVTVIDTITFPTGLQSKLAYTFLGALDANINSFNLPACSQRLCYDASGNIASNTVYHYVESTSGSYTGANIGCRMGGSVDSLMETNNRTIGMPQVVVRPISSNV